MARDFTAYDAYLDASSLSGATYPDGIGLMYYEAEGARATTNSLPLRPVRQDVGNNPNEVRPEYGDFFSQAEFFKGMGQSHYHHAGSQPELFFHSDGIDFSQRKVRNHLRSSSLTLGGSGYTAAGGGRWAQAGGFIYFVAQNNDIRRTNNLSTSTTENPHVAEATTDIYDITSRGDEVLAALGNNGIHIRSAAGTWSHWQPDGSTNLNVGDARKIAYVRGRIVVAGTGGREIFEVTSSSTPTKLGDTLPAGWEYTDIGESGQFIYATAANATAGMSRIYIFGLNASTLALEPKGNQPMDIDEMAYCVAGYLNMVFVGVGRENNAGGYDPILYLGTPNDSGFLTLVRVSPETTSTGAADMSIRAIEPIGGGVLCGFSLNSGSPFGGRQGVGFYDIAQGAFFHHQVDEGITAGWRTIAACGVFNGKVFWVPSNVNWADTVQGYKATGTLVSSIADFNNAGLKVWDLIEVVIGALPSTSTQVDVYYTTDDPRTGSWTLAGSITTVGATGGTFRLSGVESRLLALKIELRAGVGPGSFTNTPELKSFSVRSHPTVSTSEWTLTRYVIFSDKARKDRKAPLKNQQPRTLRRDVQNLLNKAVTLYEQDGTWTARLERVADMEPMQPSYAQTQGNADRDVYVMQLQLQGTRD